MAGKSSGAKGSGRNRVQARSAVTRARRTRPEQRDPGGVNAGAQQARQASAKPGQQATGKTKAGAVPVPSRGPSQSSVRSVRGRGVQDKSSAATGSSLFEKADARNRKLGQRNRPTA